MVLLIIFTGFILASVGEAATGGWSVDNYSGLGLPKATLTDIVTNIAKWILAIFGFIAVIGFVISGIMYLVVAGDEDGQARAKRAMIYSITGVIVGLSGLVIIYAVNSFLKVSTPTTGSSVIEKANNAPVTGATVPSTK
jgi:hypothetical protein